MLLTKVCNVWAKKDTEELFFLTLERDAKFEEKLTCGLENNMRNLESFHESTWKSWNWVFYGVLSSKVENDELKIYRGVMLWQWRMIQNFKRDWVVSSKLK